MANLCVNLYFRWDEDRPDTTGQQYVEQIAHTIVPYLRTNGVLCIEHHTSLNLQEVAQNFTDSFCSLYVELYPKPITQEKDLTVIPYRHSPKSNRGAKIFAEQLKKIFPTVCVKEDELCVLQKMEQEWKVDRPVVWIGFPFSQNSSEPRSDMPPVDCVAAKLAEAITIYFGVPFLSSPQEQRLGKVQTRGGNLNIRRKATTDSEIVGEIPNGAVVTVFGEINNWFVVQYERVVGYVRGDYLKITP